MNAEQEVQSQPHKVNFQHVSDGSFLESWKSDSISGETKVKAKTAVSL